MMTNKYKEIKYRFKELMPHNADPCMMYLSEKEQPKMTRQHAHELVFGKCKTMEGKEVATLLDAIEALGLIKFEEEKFNDDSVICITTVNIKDKAVYVRFGDIANAIAVQGYKIVLDEKR